MKLTPVSTPPRAPGSSNLAAFATAILLSYDMPVPVGGHILRRSRRGYPAGAAGKQPRYFWRPVEPPGFLDAVTREGWSHDTTRQVSAATIDETGRVRMTFTVDAAGLGVKGIGPLFAGI